MDGGKASEGGAVEGHSRTVAPGELRQVLNVLLGVAIVVGGAIGVGILRTPGLIAGQLFSPALILAAWFAGGLLAALGANCYAELATCLPKAGGPYVYARRALGPFGGFAVGWGDWAISIAVIAFLSVALAEFVLGETAQPAAVPALAVALIAAVGILNWFGLKLGARSQQLLSFAKLAGLLGLTVVCLVMIEPAAAQAAPRAVQPAHLAVVAFLSSLMIVSETYAGWNSSVYFSEEDKDSARNVPRALFWGIGAVMFAYLLFNIGLLAALPMSELSQSKLPAAAAAEKAFGAAGGSIVTAFAIVSLLGILNVTVMFTPRIVFGMSRDGYLPKSLSRLNRAASPGVAMVVTLLISSVLAAGFAFETLFGIAAFLGVGINTTVYLCLFRLRATEPELVRPYRAYGYPWLPAIAVLVSLGLLVNFVVSDPLSSFLAAAALLLTWPVYRFTQRTAASPRRS
jgi:APA family basic amino acid/polyamine antiporter